MRLLITADLHYNHRHSRPLAEELIGRMNRAGGDVLVLAGDTAAGDGDDLERCLSLFRFDGPKLFIPGNHELWTRGQDSYALYHEQLPRRVTAMGWRWLCASPFVQEDRAVIGSLGWYDYSFAQPWLGIPRRFYEAKVSPGAALRSPDLAGLFEPDDDISSTGREIIARWNDGRYVKLGRSDQRFLDELLEQLRRQLDSVRGLPSATVVVHHLPFAELLPPAHSAQWDFAKAYLGSGHIGRLLQEFKNVTRVFCGHSHYPAEAQLGRIRAINIGSGYRWKTFHTVDL